VFSRAVNVLWNTSIHAAFNVGGMTESRPIDRALQWARERDWDDATLAMRLNTSQQRIYNWKKRGMPPAQHAAVAALFGRSVDQLLGVVEPAASLPHAKVEPVTGSTRAVPLAHAESLRPGEMWLPQYEGVRAMMGDGSDGTNDVVTLVRVSEEGLRRRLIRTSFTSLSNLKLISAYGDSMAGTFEDGDVILVDVGVTAVDRDGVYVYSRDDELLVKRLQREDDGSLTVISDNPRYRDRHIAREDRAIYRVHGRALLAWTARVL